MMVSHMTMWSRHTTCRFLCVDRRVSSRTPWALGLIQMSCVPCVLALNFFRPLRAYSNATCHNSYTRWAFRPSMAHPSAALHMTMALPTSRVSQRLPRLSTLPSQRPSLYGTSSTYKFLSMSCYGQRLHCVLLVTGIDLTTWWNIPNGSMAEDLFAWWKATWLNPIDDYDYRHHCVIQCTHN